MSSMKKPSGRRQGPNANTADKPTTLRDLLGADTIAKLKQQAEKLRHEEAAKQEAERAEAEAAPTRGAKAQRERFRLFTEALEGKRNKIFLGTWSLPMCNLSL